MCTNAILVFFRHHKTSIRRHFSEISISHAMARKDEIRFDKSHLLSSNAPKISPKLRKFIVEFFRVLLRLKFLGRYTWSIIRKAVFQATQKIVTAASFLCK